MWGRTVLGRRARMHGIKNAATVDYWIPIAGRIIKQQSNNMMMMMMMMSNIMMVPNPDDIA